MRRSAAVLAAAIAVTTAGCTVPGGGGGTGGSQSFAVPASGVFTVVGHGWGHGHGMSQWGAQGAASLGVPASTIMSTYYPGTTATTIANSPIRVRLTATNTYDLAVLAQPGLTVTDQAGRTVQPTNPASMWRILSDAQGQHLQRYINGQWLVIPVQGATNLATPVRFSNVNTGIVNVVYPSLYSRAYRGSVMSWQINPGYVYNINSLAMDDYLRGVVPQEASPSWYPAALQAQAIAARTYAAQQRSAAGVWSTYDICDSSACQAYGGSSLRSSTGVVTPIEYPQTDAAIAATAGQIRTYGGAPAFTQFSSSNGGFSVDGGQPYLVAKADPWDGAVANPMHTWSATLPVSTIQAYYPAVGKLQRIVISTRDGNGDWGGRINTVVLQGVDGAGHATSVTTTGGALYGIRPFGAYSDGLRSTWWTITNGGT
jgi:stage II sporulation protein D